LITAGADSSFLFLFDAVKYFIMGIIPKTFILNNKLLIVEGVIPVLPHPNGFGNSMTGE
jgi:hypothetical protein